MRKKLRSVIIFTLPTCEYCKRTKAFLDSLGVEYKNIDVSASERNYNLFIKTTKQESVPAIIIDGEQHIGFNESLLRKLLT